MKKKNLYIAAALLMAVGVVGAGIFIFKSYSMLGEEMQKFEMPGTAEVEFKDPGKYTFYHEFRTVVDGQNINTDDVPIEDYRFSLSERESGEEAVIIRLDGKQKYSFRDREGRTLFEAEIEQPGTYVLTGEGKAGQSGESAGSFIVTLDRGFLVQRLTSILGGQIIMLIPAILALIIFVYAYSMKEKG